MKHLLPVSFLAFLFVACSPPTYLPDGGRPRQTCQTTFTTIPVKTQDLMGVPIPEADVTARNVSNGKLQTARTNGSGDTTAITEELGNGQVELTAVAGALSTRQVTTIQLLCGECDCTAMPGNAILTLQ